MLVDFAASLVVMAKLIADERERCWIRGNVPVRLLEMAMAKITGEQKEVMRYRGCGAAPLRDPARGEGVTEIV